jgi:hypothetical protein
VLAKMLALALATVAASPGGIAFRSLAKGAPAGEQPPHARVYVATTKSQLAGFASLLPEAAAARVNGVVLPSRAVIAVFLGTKPTAGYEVAVRRVAVVSGRLRITVEVVQPSPDAILAQVLTSPFHVVTVARSALPARLPSRWALVDAAGKTVATGTFRR